MKWKQVPAKRVQPRGGTYRNWKTPVANDCGEQCVYCAIHESRYGGLDNFHVEHYRPKSRPEFKRLTNAITNLFLACAICNRFKGDDWPGDPLPDHSRIAYPDPSACDYNTIFYIDPMDFRVGARHLAATYVVNRLYLNRPQLILERRTAALERRIEEMETFFQQASDASLALGPNSSKVGAALLQLAKQLVEIRQMLRDANKARPYELSDIRKPTR